MTGLFSSRGDRTLQLYFYFFIFVDFEVFAEFDRYLGE